MIRLIFEETDNTLVSAGACEQGITECKSFDVVLPEIEQWFKNPPSPYFHRRFIGIEVVNGGENGR